MREYYKKVCRVGKRRDICTSIRLILNCLWPRDFARLPRCIVRLLSVRYLGRHTVSVSVFYMYSYIVFAVRSTEYWFEDGLIKVTHPTTTYAGFFWVPESIVIPGSHQRIPALKKKNRHKYRPQKPAPCVIGARLRRNVSTNRTRLGTPLPN